MGLLSWFYGSGPRVTAKDRAILDLKRQRDKVRQYQKRIAIVLEREHNLAKECLGQGDRKRALLFLKKEQFQKQLLVKTDEQLANLEELVTSIEFAQVQRDVVFGLEQGARVLKEVNAEMSLEKVDKIMDDSAEGIAYQQELEDILGERITRADEEAIERELEQMERDVNPKNKQSNKPVIEMPQAPKTVPKTERPQQQHAQEAEEAEEEEEAQEDRLLAS